MIGKLPKCSLILPLILCHISTSAQTAFSQANSTDYQALVAIKRQIILNPANALSSWNDSIHFCAWNGVTCGKKHQRVTALNLSSLHLVGKLSLHIGNLSFLRVLNLDNNEFTGILPQELSQLYRLQELRMSNNSFEGEIPRNLTNWADLWLLDLIGNNLRGQIPEELGSLPKLRAIGLSANHIAGFIPPSLGNVTALESLYLADNHIEGSIPLELGNLPILTFLQLSYNNLSGHIPTALYNVSSIELFSVVQNKLNGSLPSNLFLTLPELQELYLDYNGFSGPVPTTITNASQLALVDLGWNSFSGPVPVDLGALKNLEYLNFASNFLGSEEGDNLRLLASVTNCTKLRVLWLPHNGLKGLLPDSIANFSTTFTSLRLEDNSILGEIPSDMGNLVNLELLALYNNMLSGRIPDSIGKLSKLKIFFIQWNNFSGVIPTSIGNMSALSRLALGNMIEGTIPASIGNCTNLNLLYLSQNRLVGPVPEQIVSLSSLSLDLVLSDNYLTGPIPEQIGRLVNLKNLDFSDNDMSGEIPPALGNCLVLELVSLHGNHFSGTIPPSLEKLRGLQVLDLSQNNFSGQIPGFFGNLPFIQNLNLSFNMFEGEVPDKAIFGNLSIISVVGNDKLCGGPPTLQLPKCDEGTEEKHRSSSMSRRKILVVSVTIPIFLLVAGGFILLALYRSKGLKGNAPSAPDTEDRHPRLSYAELFGATDGFSLANKIGEGSFSVVYKGTLSRNEQVVAVKVLKLEERGASKSFMAECEALRNIRHRNLVKTITTCSAIDFQGNDFKALVFEYMPNGSLEKWLHTVPHEIGGYKSTGALSVLQRLNIIIDVATALDYLHHGCHTPIVHCDLKPSNVLLDRDFSAHVSDFGLVKFLMARASASQTSSAGIRGTVGYIAPEYGVGGEVSAQGDVYSFGILLLEMFTGKRPTEPMFADNFGLHEFVERSLPNGLNQVIDPTLFSGDVQGNLHQCLVSVLEVGLVCSAAQPNERMDIGEAAAKLQKAHAVLYACTRRTRV